MAQRQGGSREINGVPRGFTRAMQTHPTAKRHLRHVQEFQVLTVIDWAAGLPSST